MQLNGVYVPIVTPFDEHGEINYNTLNIMIEWLVKAGIQGIVVAGTTGEYYALSSTEQNQLFKYIAERVNHRLQLIAGINDTCYLSSINKAKWAHQYGYQGLMLAPPAYALPNQEEIISFYNRIGDATSLPIILYNFPARTGINIELDTVEQLSKLPFIRGIKESSGDFNRGLHLVSLQTDEFSVLCGSDEQAGDYLFWGAAGMICGAVNIIPQAFVRLFNAAELKDWVTLREVMLTLYPLLQALHPDVYTQLIKACCEKNGFNAGDVRSPLQPADDTIKRAFLNCFEIVSKG